MLSIAKVCTVFISHKHIHIIQFVTMLHSEYSKSFVLCRCLWQVPVICETDLLTSSTMGWSPWKNRGKKINTCTIKTLKKHTKKRIYISGDW